MTTESKINRLIHTTRIGQFVSVGAIGATIETIIVTILTAGLGIGPLFAKAIGAEVSISIMFGINDKWTFATEGSTELRAVLQRWMKSHLVRTGGLAVSFTTLYLLTSFLEMSITIYGADFWPAVANFIGIGVGMVLNYVAESLITWDI
ncbi:GtrA family protein [Halorubrum sp. CBA1229]|uniref:GtrA family protein n=1 Tax=Halorubrum sp. CBA1229 TaxID=1853699 RepID=UPI001315A416|nr:GtrA family protein [Halorubrum sp. CBA1229]QKY15566.1 GtrA family protein [Halorubrum sp. CBA1229]